MQNFVGEPAARPFRAVLRTLLASFAQCRGFAESINMVVLCTRAHSPLLTFRRPRGPHERTRSRATRDDVSDDDGHDYDGDGDDYLGSPLRHHVYNTFYEREIVLEDLLTDGDMRDPEMLLRRGKQRLEAWQVEGGISTSQEIQKRKSREATARYLV